MKCRIVKMRKAGVTLPKRDLINTGEAKGELSIINTHEQSFNRIVKIAQHQCGVAGYPHMLQLYEPQLLWMNEDRFVLTGFERDSILFQDGFGFLKVFRLPALFP